MPQAPATGGFRTLQSTDEGEARARLAADYTAHQMDVAGGGFDFLHMSARIPQGSFNILRYGSAVEIRPEEFGDFYMLEMPLSGGVTLDSAGARARSGKDVALLIPPNLRFTSVWEPGTVQVMLKLRAEEVLTRWQRVSGDATAGLPEAPPEIDLTSPQGWRIREMLGLLRAEAMRAARENIDLLSTTPLAGALVDTVVAWLHDVHGRRLDPGRQVPLPARLKRVLAFIETHLAEELTVGQMADLAGVSERSVFNLFAQFLETTPMAWVADRRLARSRQLLTSGAGTVSAAARAAGIAHPGRFGRAYRRKFGEMPSDTLRQSVRRVQGLSQD